MDLLQQHHRFIASKPVRIIKIHSMHQLQQNPETFHLDVAEVSLVCPLSHKRIKKPTRSLHCTKHIEAFDQDVSEGGCYTGGCSCVAGTSCCCLVWMDGLDGWIGWMCD